MPLPDNIVEGGGAKIITDFVGGLDRIDLSETGFDSFDSLHRLVYNSTTGALYYDADGSGVSFNPMQFATLIGAPNLTFEDFSILGVG